MHIFKAIEQKLTIVTTSIEQRDFLIKVIDYIHQDPSPTYTLRSYNNGEQMFEFELGLYPMEFDKLELTFNIKQLSAILNKHSSTVHQLLKRPNNWKAHNIASKNKCGKEIVVTLKF